MKKELDKEIKDIRKTTLMVNKRMQKLVGLNNEEDESDEENEELEDYLNDVNDEEVSSILLKAEQEMKEEEEEKERGKKEKEEENEKMEQSLKEELERISDDEKEKKKKKKKKPKKKKKEKSKKDEDEEEEEDEEDSYDDFEEYKKWKKMRKMEREKKKEEKNKKKENKDKEEKRNEEKEEIYDDKKEKKENKKEKKEEKKEKKEEKKEKKEEKKETKEDKHEEKKKEISRNLDNNYSDNEKDNKKDEKDDYKEEKDIEYNFNLNNIDNNKDEINKDEKNNDINNNNTNNDVDSNNVNINNNDIEQNNKQRPIIPKNIYEKISSTDKKVIIDLLKAANAKYQEGEIFSSMGKYSEALKCYYQAKNLFLGINKLVQSKKNVYPREFRMIITSKINDKLKLVHQSAMNCSNAFKEKRIGQIINKNAMKNNQNNNIKTTVNNNINKTMNTNINNTINNNIENKNSNEINNNLDLNTNNPNNNNTNNNNYNFDFNALNNDNNNNNNNQNIKLGNTKNTQSNQNKPKSLHDKEEDAMDQKILSEIMTKNPGVKFSDIIGMNDMKQTLYEIIVVPTIRPDLFTGIRTPQRGILLFGPPGTGKTMIAKAIASECGSTFFNISASSLTSKWVGESEKTVKSLFKIAYQKVPSIIFIDEIDSILSKRSEGENEATKRLKTEFLIQFDGLGSNTKARLLVIAATNRPMDLDEALLRRLPKRVYCGPLDEDGRFEFIKKVINRVDTDLSDEDIREIAKMTNDYSNSDLMELCREAAYKPVRELTNEEIMKLDKFRPIKKKDLVDAAHKIRGTLSKKVKEDLRKWNEQFGGV